MIEKTIYVAVDGKEFSDKSSCLAYEKSDAIKRSMLSELISKKCMKTYDSEACYSFPTVDDFIAFVMDHSEEIQNIMNVGREE